jgi:hypothetical protein
MPNENRGFTLEHYFHSALGIWHSELAKWLDTLNEATP